MVHWLTTDGLLCNTAQVSLTVNLLPTRLVWSDKLPWLLSGDSLKSRAWNATLAERSPARRNKPGFVLSLVDGIPLESADSCGSGEAGVRRPATEGHTVSPSGPQTPAPPAPPALPRATRTSDSPCRVQCA